MEKLHAPRRTGVFILLAALAAIATAILVTRSIGGDVTLAEQPERSAEGREIHWFETPKAMFDGSAVVVTAEVTGSRAGATVGDPDDRTTQRVIDVRVIEVLKGEAPQTLSIHDGEWDSSGIGVVVNSVNWSVVGDQATFFLTPGDQPDVMDQISSYGRVVHRGKVLGPTGHHPYAEGPWTGQTEVVTTDQVRALVNGGL
jgi:hypothetical protein